MKRDILHDKKLYFVLYIALSIVLIVWIRQFFQPHQRNILSYAEAERNIQYCNDFNLNQTLDIYRPKHSKDKNLPVVFYIHGGGWRGGTKNDDLIMNVWGPHFIKRGMTVVTIGYQTKAPNLYQTANDDIACALAFMTKNSDKYKIDLDRVVYFGDSAGAQLASYAALNVPYKDYTYSPPQGVINFYGVSDLSKIVVGQKPDYNARHYLGKDYIKKAPGASPVNLVTAKSPPFLLVHGTGDSVVPLSQSEEFYKKLKSTGVPATFIKIPDAGHAFNGPELGRQQYKIIKQAVNQFLDETIGG